MANEYSSVERESISSEVLPDLSCENYRKLTWEMPVDIPENICFGGQLHRRLTGAARPRSKKLKIRDDQYFRSSCAIHFCHNPQFVREYSVRGARDRDERRLGILGHTYYCVNHPPHYRLMEHRLEEEMNLEEDLKAKLRKMQLRYTEPPLEKEVDPVLRLPAVPSLIGSNMDLSSPVPVNRSAGAKFTSSATVSPTPQSEPVGGVQSIDRLYKQSQAILKNILPSPEPVNAGMLQQIYKNNLLTAFETYNDLAGDPDDDPKVFVAPIEEPVKDENRERK